MVGVGHEDHAVGGRRRDLLAPGGHTGEGGAPGPVVTSHRRVAQRLVVSGAVDGDADPVSDLVPDPDVQEDAVVDLGDDAGRQAGGQRVTPLPLGSAGRPE